VGDHGLSDQRLADDVRPDLGFHTPLEIQAPWSFVRKRMKPLRPRSFDASFEIGLAGSRGDLTRDDGGVLDAAKFRLEEAATTFSKERWLSTYPSNMIWLRAGPNRRAPNNGDMVCLSIRGV